MKINYLNRSQAPSANPTKWSNTLKQFVGNFRWIFLSVFDHFVGLVLNRLNLFTLTILTSISNRITVPQTTNFAINVSENVKWPYSLGSRALSEYLMQVYFTPCVHGDGLVISLPDTHRRSERQLLPRKITTLKFAFNGVASRSP